MKFIFTILTLLLLLMGVDAQKLSPDKYFIPFADKNQSHFSILRPEEFLSARAIERRLKYNIEVGFDDLPVNVEYIDSLYNIGFHVLGSSKWLNGVIVQTNDTSLFQSLKEVSFVLPFDYRSARWQGRGGVERKYSREHFVEENYSLVFAESNKQMAILNGDYLHNLGYKGNDMRIAVLDLGFMNVDIINAFNHLWESNRILGYRDFVQGSNPGVFNSGTHGTIVLSTMAAIIPNEYSGTAPEASFYLLRTEDNGSEYRVEEAYWLLGAEYADSVGADIITSSLGYNTFNDSLMNYTQADLNGEIALVTTAAELASQKGIFVVTSAGNSGNKNWYNISFPADGKNVLAVGAIDTSLNVVDFSSRGPSADGRIKPEVVAVGYKTKIVNANGELDIGYGTSYAAPQIAGLVACLWQSNPGKSPLEVRNAILTTSSKFFNPDESFGYGIPDFGMALAELKHEPPEYRSNIFIAPNPFHTGFRFRFENIQEPVESLRIISNLGQIVYIYHGYWENNEDGLLNGLDFLKSGMYLLEGISKDGSLYRTKIIKY
jgi:serine protease AprX